MQTFEIKNRWNGKVLFSAGGETLRDVVQQAVQGGANLRSANLSGADLRGANLGGADLGDADLGGANLGGKKLAGARPFIQIGPIGSRSDYLQAFVTDRGLMIRAGCFFDTRDQFELRIVETHGDNEHAQEYRAALALIDAHAKLWPADAAKMEAAEVAA